MDDIALLEEPQPLPGQTREQLRADYVEGLRRLEREHWPEWAGILQQLPKREYRAEQRKWVETAQQMGAVDGEPWEAQQKMMRASPDRTARWFHALAEFKQPYHVVNTLDRFLLWLAQWKKRYQGIESLHKFDSVGRTLLQKPSDGTRQLVQQAVTFANQFGVDRASIGVYELPEDVTYAAAMVVLDKLLVATKGVAERGAAGTTAANSAKPFLGFRYFPKMTELANQNIVGTAAFTVKRRLYELMLAEENAKGSQPNLDEQESELRDTLDTCTERPRHYVASVQMCQLKATQTLQKLAIYSRLMDRAPFSALRIARSGQQPNGEDAFYVFFLLEDIADAWGELAHYYGELAKASAADELDPRPFLVFSEHAMARRKAILQGDEIPQLPKELCTVNGNSMNAEVTAVWLQLNRRLAQRVKTITTTVQDPGADVAQAKPAAATAAEVVIGKGKRWQVAMKEAEDHLVRNPFPGVKALARIILCSPSTMSKAIDRSIKLRAAFATYKSHQRSVSAVALTRGVAASTAQTREPDPAEKAAESTDAVFQRLLEEATPAERAKLNAMSTDQRRELIATCQHDPDAAQQERLRRKRRRPPR